MPGYIQNFSDTSGYSKPILWQPVVLTFFGGGSADIPNPSTLIMDFLYNRNMLLLLAATGAADGGVGDFTNV